MRALETIIETNEGIDPVIHHEVESLKDLEESMYQRDQASGWIKGKAFKELDNVLNSKLKRMIILSNLLLISNRESSEIEAGLLRYASKFGECWICAECITDDCLRGFGLENFYKGILRTDKAKVIISNRFAEAYAEAEHPEVKSVFKKYFQISMQQLHN